MAFSRFAFFLAGTVACGSALAEVESTYYGEIPHAGDVNAVAEYEALRKFGQGVPATNVKIIPNTRPCPPATPEIAGDSSPQVIKLTLYFNTDKYECGGDHTKALMQAIAAVSEHLKDSRVQVLVLGNTDGRAPYLYNLDLGFNRAESLADKLREEGFRPTRTTVRTCGEIFSASGPNNQGTDSPAERHAVAYFFTKSAHLTGLDMPCAPPGVRVAEGVKALTVESALRPDG